MQLGAFDEAMRFLPKYKMKDGIQTANARIILQGFKHVDVASKKLETESPTLSRVGRNLVMLMCTVHAASLEAAKCRCEARLL